MNLAFVGMAAALGLSASGSAFGAGFAGQAADKPSAAAIPTNRHRSS